APAWDGIARHLIHDPDDRAGIAYLASTKQGRRVYLNRLLTDADVVIPVGRLAFDPELGIRGPWSVLFPGLSDRQTMRDLRVGAGGPVPSRAAVRHEARLDELCEVGWLLGTHLLVGILPGATGVREVVAGRVEAVRERAIAALEQDWTMQAPSRAEL